MKKTFLQIVAIVTIFSTTSFSQKLPYKVAYDKFGVVGEYPHLWESTKNLHYSEKQVSFDILEEKSTFRDNVIARENLTIRYMDAVKEAKYAAKITFFSTDTNLVQQILVDEKIVREEVLIPVNEVFHLEINIPKEALQDGTFEITIRKTKGNWATASEVAIFSNEDKVLKEDNYLATIKVPRISPIPEKINDTDELIKNLDGIWQFNPAPEKGFENKVANKKWSDIIVPAEWSMQGFNVNEDSTAAYFRTFNIPSNWEGKRIKLLFNSIYSDVTVFVNGKKAGSHMGGFTAFELDVTDIVKYNSPNKLMLAVKSESLADELSSASAYACHPLGGIQRSVSIFALPQVNISDLAITTILTDYLRMLHFLLTLKSVMRALRIFLG